MYLGTLPALLGELAVTLNYLMSLLIWRKTLIPLTYLYTGEFWRVRREKKVVKMMRARQR